MGPPFLLPRLALTRRCGVLLQPTRILLCALTRTKLGGGWRFLVRWTVRRALCLIATGSLFASGVRPLRDLLAARDGDPRRHLCIRGGSGNGSTLLTGWWREIVLLALGQGFG